MISRGYRIGSLVGSFAMMLRAYDRLLGERFLQWFQWVRPDRTRNTSWQDEILQWFRGVAWGSRKNCYGISMGCKKAKIPNFERL